jgi:hypothetical protein
MVAKTSQSPAWWHQVRYWHLRVSEKYNERRFGIASDGCVSSKDLGITEADSMEYAPVPYRVLRKILKIVGVRLGISIVHADALDYQIPDDATVFFFQNPFHGETLRKVINNIHDCLLRSPRKLQIIYYNRLFFDAEASQLNWIKKIRQEPCFPRASWPFTKQSFLILKLKNFGEKVACAD